jgi:phosphatidylinositol alpha-1,6-mannosyltransferase
LVPDLRVLIVTSDFPPMLGGIQHLVLRVAENLGRSQVRVVASAEPGSAEVDRALPFAVARVGPQRYRQASLAAVNAQAVREARAFRPDVILVGHIIASPGARLAGRVVGAPVVQYFHANEVGARPKLARFAYQSAAASICVSTFTRALVRQVAGDDERAHVINNGVDLPPAQSPNGDRPGPPTIVTVARMEERYKGHDVMARALPLIRSQVPDARWVVIGDGRLRPTFESLVAANGASDAAVFTGSVSDAERDAWLERSHVFAMLSRLPAGRPGGEGFGIVFLEAGAHGLPVVAGGVGGAVDAVRDGETGLLVDPTDHLAAAEAVTQLLRDPERAHKMAVAGRAFAEAHSWPAVTRQVEDLLLAVAGR